MRLSELERRTKHRLEKELQMFKTRETFQEGLSLSRNHVLTGGLLLMLGLLTACGGETDTDSPPAADPSTETAAEGDATGDVLLVGTNPTDPPHNFLDESEEYAGWENDFMTAIAENLGMTVEYVPGNFDTMIPGIEAGRFDVAIANVGITEERKEVVDFVSVLSPDQAILGSTENDLQISEPSDLCDLGVAVSRGGTQEELATGVSETCVANGRPPIDIQLYANNDDNRQAVASGRADVYWTAAPGAAYTASNPESGLDVKGVFVTELLTGIVFPKDSDLVEPIHETVQALIDDGTYMNILEDWDLTGDAIDMSEINPDVGDPYASLRP